MQACVRYCPKAAECSSSWDGDEWKDIYCFRILRRGGGGGGDVSCLQSKEYLKGGGTKQHYCAAHHCFGRYLLSGR